MQEGRNENRRKIFFYDRRVSAQLGIACYLTNLMTLSLYDA